MFTQGSSAYEVKEIIRQYENVTVEELKQLANEIFTPENMSISVGYDSWYTKKSTLEKKCRKMRKILKNTGRTILMMNKISIITFVGMIITGLISVAVFLTPVSGFFMYPFFAGFAALLGIVSALLAREHKILRVFAILIVVILVGTILCDVIFVIRFMTGMF